jgi:hypothetical protein
MAWNNIQKEKKKIPLQMDGALCVTFVYPNGAIARYTIDNLCKIWEY